MAPALMPLITLLLLGSIMLAVVFVLAWETMGRPRHSLSWAAAFACGAVSWAMNLAEGILFTAGPLYFGIAALPLLGAIVLTVVGYRQRSNLPVRAILLWPIILVVMTASILTSTWWRHAGIQIALMPFCAATMLPVAIHAILVKSETRSSAERASIAILAMFAAFEVGITVLALRIGIWGSDDSAYDLYAITLFFGLPSLYIALGVSALFLMMADQTQILDHLATHDGMSKLLNRSGFRHSALRCAADTRADCIVVGDIDHFKQINDRWGHAAGDLAIICVAETLRSTLRSDDVIGRIGGEEFAILLPRIDEEAAIALIERMRVAISEARIAAYPDIRITMSFGVAAPDDRTFDLDEVLRLADGALYQAKLDGRNRIRIAA